ncbi:MAG: glycosyltransferase 87 family protein, partial [Chloroflexota bacterium]|nr:glycosyltransferase 87 family protein [Chloroflexota bacterium]
MLLALLLFHFALGLAILRVTTFSKGFGVRLGATSWALVDFRTAIYYPIVAFWDGINPYDRAALLAHYPTKEGFGLFLPATFLLHLPFGLLPVDAASLLYFVAVVALTVLLAYVAFKFNDLEAGGPGVFLVAALIVLSRPGQWNLLLGQLAAQLTLVTYVALYYARRSPAVSGLGLAASMVKPSIGLPLAILMLARRDRRAVLLGCAFAAIFNLPLLAVLVRRAGGVAPFMTQLVEVQREFQGRAWNDPAIS